MKYFLMQRFFLISITFSNVFSMNNNLPIVQHKFSVNVNSLGVSTNDHSYLRAERVRSNFSHLSSRELFSEFALACHETCDHYNFAAQNLEMQSLVCNMPMLQSFIASYKSQDCAGLYSINQQTINKLLPVLYFRDGTVKLELNEYERYQVARILTDHLKVAQPDRYLNILKEFAGQGNVEFAQILKEETTYGSYLKLQTVLRPYGAIYGLFSTTSFTGNISDFKKAVENNSFCKDLSQINSLASKNRFVEAKAVVDKYEKNQTSFYAQNQYKVAKNLYNSHLDLYCIRLCGAYDIHNRTPETIELVKKIPLCKTPQEVARLMYETLARNQDDYIFVKNVENLLNEQGLPRFFNYDSSVLKEVSLPSTITQDQIEDRLLLFDIAHRGARSQTEQKTFSTVVHYIEKACSNNPLAQCYSDLARTAVNALRNSSAHEATLLECGDFSKTMPTPEHETLQRRTVPLVANLINEIKRAQASKDPSVDVANLKAELKNLNEQFQRAQFSSEAQDALAVTIARLNSELKTFSRAELYRSPSMQELFNALGLDLLVSSKYGTISYEKLTEHSRIHDQRIVSQKLEEHLKNVSLKADFFKDPQLAEFCKTHKKLVEAINQLNNDYRSTLASEGLRFAAEIVFALTEDYNMPIKEVAKCAFETVTHPLEYCSRTLEGFKNTIVNIANLVKHNSVIGYSTPEEQFAYAQSCNESLHNFFNNWNQLKWQEKREFAAQLLVDTVLTKAIGSLPKMLVKTATFGELSGAVGEGFSHIVSDFSDISQGGAIAIPCAEGTAVIGKTAQAIGAIAVEGVASTPVAVSAATNSNFDSLFDFRNNNGNGDNRSLLNEKQKINYMEPGESKLIREFTNDTVEICHDHIFSKDHKKNGIMNLGATEEVIRDKFVEFIVEADKAGLMKLGDNTMHTVIHGYETIIKARITEDGIIQSMNGYLKTSKNAVSKGNSFTFYLEKYK